MSSVKEHIVEPYITATVQLKSRKCATCYNNSPATSNPSFYVSPDGLTTNNGTDLSNPVPTIVEAIDRLNRLGGWEGNANIYIMGNVPWVIPDGQYPELHIIRSAVGQSKSVTISGYTPNIRPINITNGAVGSSNLENESGADILTTYPQYDRWTVGTPLVAHDEKGCPYYVTETSTSTRPLTRGVIWDNNVSTLQPLDSSGVDRTGQYVNLVNPLDSILFSQASNTQTPIKIGTDGLDIIFKNLNLSFSTVSIDSSAPVRVQNCNVEILDGTERAIQGDVNFEGTYISSETAGVPLAKGSMKSLVLQNSFVEDSMVDFSSGTCDKMLMYDSVVTGYGAWKLQGANAEIQQSAIVTANTSADSTEFGHGEKIVRTSGFAGVAVNVPAVPVVPYCLYTHSGGKIALVNCEFRGGLTNAIYATESFVRLIGACRVIDPSGTVATGILANNGSYLEETGTTTFSGFTTNNVLGQNSAHVVLNTATVAGGHDIVPGGTLSFVGSGGACGASGIQSVTVGGDSNFSSGFNSSIVGGLNNLASGQGSHIGGGSGGVASGLYSAICGGEGSQATGNHGFVGAGLNNIADDQYSGVGCGNDNHASGDYSGIFGGQENAAGGAHSGVFGGERNNSSSPHSFVGGGQGNLASGDNSNVSGGNGCTASGSNSGCGSGHDNVASGEGSYVGGGQENVASGIRSFVGGGQENVADDQYSGVGCGYQNNAVGDYSCVYGGERNRASAAHSGVFGGENNNASNGHSFVGGGNENVASGDNSSVSGGNLVTASGANSHCGGGYNNVASGVRSHIGGGNGNIASGVGSNICGGGENQASGAFSTVPGGENNIAQGEYSVCCGHNTNDNGENRCFIFNASTTSLVSGADNRVLFGCSGGFRIYTDDLNSIGAQLASGATAWSVMCDVEQKDLYGELPYMEVAEKFEQIPIYQYQMKNRDPENTNMSFGPTAQDFAKQFPTGKSDKLIDQGDQIGVCMAAIRGLLQQQKVDRQRIATLEDQLLIKS